MKVEDECRFLSIEPERVAFELHKLGAKDHGTDLLREWIFYDKELTWLASGQVLRLRDNGTQRILAFKQRRPGSSVTNEIEMRVPSIDSCKKILEALGFCLYRYQEKRRRSISLDGIEYALDTWPGLPTYLEIERLEVSAPSLKTAASRVHLDFAAADFTDAREALRTAGINLDDFSELTFQHRTRRE